MAKDNEFSKVWKARLHDRSNQMILFASIPKGSNENPHTPNPDYRFFLESSMYSAQPNLENMLNAERGASCALDRTIAMTFFSGRLRAFNEDSLSNLSLSLFS
jgi:hypothetical protein